MRPTQSQAAAATTLCHATFSMELRISPAVDSRHRRRERRPGTCESTRYSYPFEPFVTGRILTIWFLCLPINYRVQLFELEESLAEAVSQENFELAMKCRDDICRLQSGAYVEVLQSGKRFGSSGHLTGVRHQSDS